MERIDDTGLGGIRLIQDTEGFRYGIDAVLLARFAAACCPQAGQAAELGCGNGIVSLVLAKEAVGRQVTGIELQAEPAALASRSAQLNGLADRTTFLCCDVKDLPAQHPQLGHRMDLVVSNPPYVPRGAGLAGGNTQVGTARQETTADLADFIAAAAWLLQEKGSFCLVHRPARLVDICYHCRSHRLEPKRIRFVCPRAGEPPNIVLIHCVRGGGRELQYDEPIFVHDAAGGYTDQIRVIYSLSE